jgi:hypothetical protein
LHYSDRESQKSSRGGYDIFLLGGVVCSTLFFPSHPVALDY